MTRSQKLSPSDRGNKKRAHRSAFIERLKTDPIQRMNRNHRQAFVAEQKSKKESA